jgi:hypothetical protein
MGLGRDGRAAVALAALACLFIVIGQTRVFATNYVEATGATFCNQPILNIADNRDHYFFINDSVLPAMHDAVTYARNQVYDPTNLNTFIDSTYSSTTDVNVTQGRYTGSICGVAWSTLAGYTQCVSTNSADECEQHHIFFNTNNTDNFIEGERKDLACHEIGHSVLLKHRDKVGCMSSSTIVYHIDLSGHDRVHINNHF